MDLETVHTSCNNAKTILIVAKVKDSDQLVGGFIPIRLRKPKDSVVGNRKSNSFSSTKESFIFFFTNCNDVKTGKFAYVTETKYAINYNDKCEIGFGRGHDLECKSDGNWTSTPTSYPSIGIPAVFKISQFEIFEVIRFFNGE
ncbi:11063_t:CDS:1 [Funneliformis geosporum]|nr:11063_t:CDS:1 [Funneliformis geosporum]